LDPFVLWSDFVEDPMFIRVQEFWSVGDLVDRCESNAERAGGVRVPRLGPSGEPTEGM
jgi:hypothetical protein